MTKRHVRLKKLVDNPETLIELLSKHAQSEAFRARKQTIIDGPHLDPDILFQFATDPFYQATDECARHIGKCPVCKEDYILLLQAHRELWGDDFNPVEVQQFNWGEFLKDKVSSVEMGIRSFVLQVIKSTQPEPAENTMFMMVMPQARWVETKQFFSGANMSLEIEIPKDGHVTVFTLSESGDIRLVFPLFPQVNTSVSGETITRISFEAPASLGPWTVKAILTTDDPLGSRDLPFDKSWNNRVLECLAKHIKGLDKDGWAAGTLEFEVR